MHLPGLPSLLFLAFLFVLLPLGARRTAERLRAPQPGQEVSREQYWRSAVALHAMLLALAWVTGAGFGFRIFAVGAWGWLDALIAAAALALCFALRLISRWVRRKEELRQLAVYQRAPRTRAELAWFYGAVILASVAEEAAYRGVGWAILNYSLGDPWTAALLMCLAFSLAHWNQGWKSGVTIFGLAAILHGLVAFTQTLVLAMAVHAVYDLVVGRQIRRAAEQFDRLPTVRDESDSGEGRSPIDQISA